MSDRYDPKNIEKKWQGIWEQKETFKVTEESDKKKFYLLEMFPYPSGKIHMGHVRNYSIGDVLARFLKMKGYNCLHPMGWDSFGLPAENAAIQNNVLPATWTHSNIMNMKRQLKGLGFNYDWSREITTCNPEYYKWNQWLFLKMFERGLAYKKRSSVNWCPGCYTVLANEQVEGGLCWRCESEVEERNLDQWFLKITDYADELLEYCDRLPGWPERVLVMQRNWIGKSIGAEVIFRVADSNTAGTSASVSNETIKVFTTRPDTLYGSTFMSLAPEHPMVESLIQGKEQETEVRRFIEKVKKQGRQERTTATMEKEGVFTGSYCSNPLTGKKMPIYVANFVLMGYGTGAVMAVPTHDQRDFEFAKKYNLPMIVVINPINELLEAETMEGAYEGNGIMVNSGPFNGMNNRDAMPKIVDHLEEKANGTGATTYRLRDWGISRQRYWGCPIPIIYCDTCGKVPVPDEDLPVILPKDIKLSGKGGSPLEESEEFIKTKCPKCGSSARRETDTMDTFVDSSWYFLRYASPNESEVPFDKVASEYWMPVDQYIGGIEHAVMHLLYARFFTKVLRDIGLINIDEPFKNLLTQGMVCKGTLKCLKHGYRAPEDVEDGKCKDCKSELENGPVEKMSKSKKNTVDPDKIIEKYGADTTRLFSLFAAPPHRDLEWNEDGVEGSYRFICRVWRLVDENLYCIQAIEPYNGSRPLSGYLRDTHRMTHKTIKRVTEDIEHRFHFNTAISAVMELVNALYQWEGDKRDELECSVLKEAIETIIILLVPFAPHVCEELWARLGKKGLLSTCKWPSYSEEALKVKETLVVVQINGKLRTKICVSVDATQQEVEDMAITDGKIIEWMKDKEIKKVIYVPNRLVNIVVK